MQQKSTNDSPRNVCSFSIDEVSCLKLSISFIMRFPFVILVYATGT
jgi:hypothetical protein